MEGRPPRDIQRERPGGRPSRSERGRGNDTMTGEVNKDNIEFQLISVLTIASIGIPVNLVCICVLVKDIKKRPAVFKLFLAFIATATLCLLVLSLIAVLFVGGRLFFDHGEALNYASVIFRYLRSFLDKSLSALVVLISTNRLLLINWPLVAREFVIVKHLGRTAIIIVLIVALIAIPPVLEGKLTATDENYVADTMIPYYSSILTVINFIIAIWLVGINATLTILYAKHIRRRQAILSIATRAASNTKVIYVGATVAMSTIYIINTIPTTIREILKMMNLNRFGEFSQVYAKAQVIGLILNALSAACYGPIFLYTSKENREELKKLLPCVKFRPPERNSQTK